MPAMNDVELAIRGASMQAARSKAFGKSKSTQMFFERLESNFAILKDTNLTAEGALNRALEKTTDELLVRTEKKQVPIWSAFSAALAWKASTYLLGLAASALGTTSTLRGAAISSVAIFFVSIGIAVETARGVAAAVYMHYDSKKSDFKDFEQMVRDYLESLLLLAQRNRN